MAVVFSGLYIFISWASACFLNHVHFYAGAHGFLMLLCIRSSFSSAFWICSWSLVCVVAVLGTLNFGVQTTWCVPSASEWTFEKKIMLRYYLMTNKPYSKVGVLHLILLQFSLPCILKNSSRCAFPCVVVKNSNYTVLKSMRKWCLCVLTQIQVLPQLVVLGFCFYRYEVEGVCYQLMMLKP